MTLLEHFGAPDSLDLIARGATTPADAKEALLKTLTPYFRNPRRLEEIAVVLAPEAIILRRIEQSADAKHLFEKISNNYWEAFERDSVQCFRACREWEQAIQDGISEYWSALRLNVDLNALTLHDFKFEVFRIIGLIVEGLTQPLFRELLFQARLASGHSSPADNLRDMELGMVVGELTNKFGYGEALSPVPWNVSFSQWRNMAQHFSSRIEGDRIVARYGRGTRIREIQFTKEELLQAATTIHFRSLAIKTARTIFVIDNIDQIGFDNIQLRIREDAKVLHLESSFATQGFALLRLSTSTDAVEATVQELTEMPAKNRMIHSSQLVFPIWCEFRSKRVIVNYLDRTGMLLMTSTVTGGDCIDIEKGTVSSAELANRVLFKMTDAGRRLI